MVIRLQEAVKHGIRQILRVVHPSIAAAPSGAPPLPLILYPLLLRLHAIQYFLQPYIRAPLPYMVYILSMPAFCVHLCIHVRDLQAALFSCCPQAYSDLCFEVKPQSGFSMHCCMLPWLCINVLRHSQPGLLRPSMHSLSSCMHYTSVCKDMQWVHCHCGKLTVAHVHAMSSTLMTTLLND